VQTYIKQVLYSFIFNLLEACKNNFMNLCSLTSISPIDGRYRHQLEFLDAYFSEFALIKYRVTVEVAYFNFLANKKFFAAKPSLQKQLLQLATNFSIEDALAIKEIEATTNHDVKAVEYFFKNKLIALQANDLQEWVHFGLTSQDINNTAIPLSIKHFFEYQYLPRIINLNNTILKLAQQLGQMPMLAHTHGQPASPTSLGKELMVFVERINNQIELLSQIAYTAKFGGATGNFNAHAVAFPNKNWVQLGNEFVEKHLQLQRQQFTTQIEHYDNLAAQCQAVARINNILTDLCKDVWQYISMNYFAQKTKPNEVGSSAMPHKINPIDFENAEGNFGVANAMLNFIANKLPISRLQRDLTDSTVLRNLGVPFAHTCLAMLSIEKGLEKLVVNSAALQNDLNQNWAVIAEAIQTILRRENYPNPYEVLKKLTRGNDQISQKILHNFIDNLDIKKTIKTELKAITPQNYIGVYPNF
jgi:adenylosuccinate lyase